MLSPLLPLASLPVQRDRERDRGREVGRTRERESEREKSFSSLNVVFWASSGIPACTETERKAIEGGRAREREGGRGRERENERESERARGTRWLRSMLSS